MFTQGGFALEASLHFSKLLSLITAPDVAAAACHNFILFTLIITKVEKMLRKSSCNQGKFLALLQESNPGPISSAAHGCEK